MRRYLSAPSAPSIRPSVRPGPSVRVRPRLIDELITYVLHMGNDYVTGGRTRPHPSASVRPVRTRPGPSTRPWPVRTFSHLTHIYLLQTQAHSTDQVYWVGPTQVSYALVVMPAYHVGSSDPKLRSAQVNELSVHAAEGLAGPVAHARTPSARSGSHAPVTRSHHQSRPLALVSPRLVTVLARSMRAALSSRVRSRPPAPLTQPPLTSFLRKQRKSADELEEMLRAFCGGSLVQSQIPDRL